MKTLPFSLFFSFGLSIVTGAAGAAEYEPGSGWQEFSFSRVLNGVYFNDEEPFTFTVTAAQQAVLTVLDLKFPLAGGISGGELYLPYNHGSPLHYTSLPLSPGSYSLTFWLDRWFVYDQMPLRGQFQVEILPAPQRVTISPPNLSGCIGGTASFRIQAQGEEPFAYQWFFNGTNLLAGETNARLSLINLQTNQAGLYSATISNQYGGKISPAATLQVFDACVGLNLYAGLSITGLVGRTYALEFVTNLAETNWTALATNTLIQPNWLFIDTSTPAEAKRFFRVRLQP